MQTTSETPIWGRVCGSKRTPYGSERPYIDGKWPHRSEAANEVKGSMEAKGSTEVKGPTEILGGIHWGGVLSHSGLHWLWPLLGEKQICSF